MASCDEDNRKKIYDRYVSFYNKNYPLPNPLGIPSPAYLVIGALPGESSSVRPFYTNKSFYLWDFQEPKEGSDTSRFIRADINTPFHKALSIIYCQKFDIIFTDFSVHAEIRDDTYKNLIFPMLKDRGALILAGSSFDKPIDKILNFHGYQQHVMEMTDVFYNYPESAEVYEFLITKGTMTPDKTFDVIIKDKFSSISGVGAAGAGKAGGSRRSKYSNRKYKNSRKYKRKSYKTRRHSKK